MCTDTHGITPSFNKPVSQSCAVAKSEQFWQASGQSTLADRMEDCSFGESAVVWARKPEAFVADSRSYVKYDCAVARQNFSLFATAHDCETGLLTSCSTRYLDIQVCFCVSGYENALCWPFRITITKDTKVPNAAHFCVNKEDHSLGNLLRA